MGENNQKGELAARVKALSPKRLAMLTGLFVTALATLLFTKWQEEVSTRQVETELRVAQAAATCAGTVNVALVINTPIENQIVDCHPGGAASVYHLSSTGEVISSLGVDEKSFLGASVLRTIPLGQFGQSTVEGASHDMFISWTPVDNGDAILVAAPAKNFYNRTPIWISYALILLAITIVSVSLMAAFIRQSAAAAEAAGAVETLRAFNKALTSARCCPWYYNNADRTVMFSKAFLEPLGFGARDRYFTLREISALTHPNDLRSAMAIITGDTTSISEGLIRLRNPSGAWSRVYLRTGDDATRFERSGIAFDLAGAKSITASAAIAEARLKDAIEAIPEAFILWDSRGRLVTWNRRFASVFRFPTGALKAGLSIDETIRMAGAGRSIIKQHFVPKKNAGAKTTEVELKGDRWLHISRRRTAEGGLVCIANNITEMKRRARAQKRKERVLKGAVDDLQSSRQDLSETMHKYELEKHRAEEASRSKSEFLANMSHELRTPLNAINGFSEIMQSELYGPLGDQKYKEYVDDILSSGQHLLELIDDILDMSKIEAGRIQLDPQKVEFERILNESIRLVAKRAQDANVNLTSSINHAPAVWADARAVKQVALNLLSNAIKFTDENGDVTLTAEADLDSVTLIVADSGTGIQREHLTKLGAPFELTESYASKSRRGSGLGLALSRSLMELQGGILAIASRPGKGTVACATFPRRPDAKVRLPQFIRNDAHILTTKKSSQNGKQAKASQAAAE